MKRFSSLICVALLLGFATSLQARDENSSATKAVPNKDEVLAQQLQKNLSDYYELRNVAVTVDDRVATLEGTVQSFPDKLKAEHIAHKEHGIEGIRDYIVVKPDVPVADEELRENIANRLRYDRIGYGIMFNNFQVTVKDGVVTISGQARTDPDKASALAIVESTPGVRDVNDEISVLPLSDFDDDLRVRTAMAIYGDPVMRKYASDPQARIRIVVDHGDVQLYGVVDNPTDRQIAEMRAKAVPGVFSVEDHLLVATELNPRMAENKSGNNSAGATGAGIGRSKKQ
jgi:hyperosmotically inducible protein